MNIRFSKEIDHRNRTRHVKHGFSWQVFFFGWFTYLWRGQYMLALCVFLGSQALYLVIGLLAAIMLQTSVDGARLLGLLAVSIIAGFYGNKLSARDYLKKGWLPVDPLPDDWKTADAQPATTL